MIAVENYYRIIFHYKYYDQNIKCPEKKNLLILRMCWKGIIYAEKSAKKQ